MIQILILMGIFFVIHQQTINQEKSVEYRMIAKIFFYGCLAALYVGWIILAQIIYLDGTPPWTFQYLTPIPLILVIALGPQGLAWLWNAWKAYEEKKVTKSVLIALLLLTGVAKADDYQMICFHGGEAVTDINKQVNELMKQGYSLNGQHTQCWLDLSDKCEISLCQSMVKKDKKTKPEMRHEYWIIRNSDGKEFSKDVEAMLKKGWKLYGSVSQAADNSGNIYLAQPLIHDSEVKPAEKK